MKKFMSIMMAAVVAICGLALTSCGELGEVCDKDVWIEKDYPPQDPNFTVYFYYTDNDGYKSDTALVDFIANDGEKPVNVKDAIKAGLNIFVEAKSGNDLVEAAVGKKVLFMNFPKGTIVDTIIDSVGGEEEETQKSFLDSLVINDTTWLAIEVYQKMWNKGGTAVPYCLKASNNYKVSTDITELFKNMSWKKILATILVSSLEDEQ